MRKVNEKRRRQCSGHAVMESALVFLPLVVLLFGLIDFSMLIFLRSAFQHAVREAVRVGVTFPTSYNGMACATQKMCMVQAAQDNAVGFLSNASYIQVNYYAPQDLSTPLSTVPATFGTAPNQVTINFFNQTGNVIEVTVVNYPWNWIAPFPGFSKMPNFLLNASASDVLQGYPVGSTTPPAP